MKIEQIKPNTYRVRKQYNGKRYTVYFDHKPTQKEVLRSISEQFDATQKASGTGSVDDYISKYISDKEKQIKPVISPATIRGYESIQRNLSEDFKALNFFDVTNDDIQNEIKRYGKTRSPKTTKNAYGLISALFAEYRHDLVLSIKLPHSEPKAEYEPTTQDIQRILEYVKGSPYSVALQLAALGLRRGEVCALELSNLSDDNVLTIDKDMVFDKHNKLVTKKPKTEASVRRILIPRSLADEIRLQGFVYSGYPNSISRYLHRVQDVLGIPRFRLHKMRAFCVAYLHKEGFSEEQIMAYGGWATASIMKQAYRYNLDPADSQKDISKTLGSLF